MSVFYSKFQMEGKSGGLVRLMRPNNLLFLIIALGVMEKWVAEPILAQYQLMPQLSWWQLLLLIAGVVLIAAGGFVANDYFDVKIDAINRPDVLIVSRDVTKEEAMILFRWLTAAGIGCGVALAVVLKSVLLGSLFVIVPGMLWFYSSSYKRMFLVGNLVVAFFTALVPMSVAFANASAMNIHYGPDHVGALYVVSEMYVWMGSFALFAFLMTWIREVVKDLQDVEGDRELECHTFPVKYGDLSTKIFASVLIVLTCALMSYFNFHLLPVSFSWGSFVSRFYLLLMVAFVCELVLLWAAKLPTDYRNAQMLMKFILFMGTMYAICVPKILDAASMS